MFDNLELGETYYWQGVKFIPDTTDPEGKKGRWTGWFHQDVVDASKLAEEGIIRAKVEGAWHEYEVVELPETAYAPTEAILEIGLYDLTTGERPPISAAAGSGARARWS